MSFLLSIETATVRFSCSSKICKKSELKIYFPLRTTSLQYDSCKCLMIHFQQLIKIIRSHSNAVILTTFPPQPTPTSHQCFTIKPPTPFRSQFGPLTYLPSPQQAPLHLHSWLNIKAPNWLNLSCKIDQSVQHRLNFKVSQKVIGYYEIYLGYLWVI